MMSVLAEIVLHEYLITASTFELWGAALSIRLGGYQPHYFPRLHCLARMLDSDVSPIADYVQYVRKHAFPGPNGTRINGPSYQAQTPVKTARGVLLLGVPVSHSGERQPLNEAQISYETDWAGKHLNIIRDSYRRAPRFEAVFPELEVLLTTRYDSLAHLDIATTAWAFAHLFGISARPATLSGVVAALPQEGARLSEIVAISSTPVMPPDKDAGRDANDWIIDMCRHFGAEEYYFGGTGAACYMDFRRFEDAGIRLKQQEWRCAEYPQQHGDFAPNLSILDLLMHLDPREARQVLHTPA